MKQVVSFRLHFKKKKEKEKKFTNISQVQNVFPGRGNEKLVLHDIHTYEVLKYLEKIIPNKLTGPDNLFS